MINAGQMHRCTYLYTFNRDIGQKLPLFPTFNAPIFGVSIGIPWKRLYGRKLDSRGYHAVKTVSR